MKSKNIELKLFLLTDYEKEENYFQMFEDYGWEYMQDLNEYSYFRKKAVNLNQEDLEIFSDNESKLEMLKRIFIKRMLPILAIFAFCFIPMFGNWTSGKFNGAFGIGYFTVMSFIFVLYIWMIVHCGIDFYRLNKKYRQL